MAGFILTLDATSASLSVKLSTSLPVELRGESYRRLTECGFVPAVFGHISQITKSLSAANGAEPNVKEMTILEPSSKIVNKVAQDERSAFLEHMDACEKLYFACRKDACCYESGRKLYDLAHGVKGYSSPILI